MDNGELMSRRRFFKKAANGLIPMLGSFIAAPTILSSLVSCGECSGCESECMDSCTTGCTSYCTNMTQNSPSSQKGDGSKGNPFSATEARNYAAALTADEITSKSFYVKGEVSSIKYNYSVEYGTAVFFIADDGKTENVFQVYNAYYLENKPYTTGALLNVGDNVVVYGKICNYRGNTPELAEKQGFLYSLNGKTSLSGNTCSECSSNCSSVCTKTCANACKAQTSQSCSNCASNCSSSCTETCANVCKAQTSQDCSNCASQCLNGCGNDCDHTCSGLCGRECRTSCGGQCWYSICSTPTRQGYCVLMRFVI